MNTPTDAGTEDPVATLNREFPGQRVLIADDDGFIRMVLMDMLGDTGLSLDEAQNGLEAVALCRNTRYSLILMDLQMPHMSGLEATRQIRQLPGMERTPILALTGNSALEDRIRCTDAGMSDFITKPIDIEPLAAKLLHCLRSNQA